MHLKLNWLSSGLLSRWLWDRTPPDAPRAFSSDWLEQETHNFLVVRSNRTRPTNSGIVQWQNGRLLTA